MAKRSVRAAVSAPPKRQECVLRDARLGEALLMVQEAGKLAGRVVNGCVRVDHFGRSFVLECSNGYNACARAILETVDEGIPFTAVVPIHEFYAKRDVRLRIENGSLWAGGSMVPTLSLATPVMPIPPGIDPSGSAVVNAERLLAAIEYADLARSLDDARPHLTAMRFETRGETLRAVTTDGHRLATADVHMTHGAAELTSFTMPAGALKTALAVLRAQAGDAHATIARRGRRVCVTGANGWQIEFDDQDGSGTDAAFPPWEHSVLSPDGYDAKVSISAEELKPLRKIVAAASKARAPQTIALSSTHPDPATPDAPMPTTVHVERVVPSGERNTPGTTVESADLGTMAGRTTLMGGRQVARVGVQGRYLRDALHGIGGEGLQVKLYGDIEQIHVLAPGRFSLIMPVKL